MYIWLQGADGGKTLETFAATESGWMADASRGHRYGVAMVAQEVIQAAGQTLAAVLTRAIGRLRGE